MVEDSKFRGVIDFLGTLGIYDVVLPFLLVFAIIFAILEKTKVFGIEKIGDVTTTRKQINAIVAFVIGFFVIASSQLVEIVTKVSSHVVVLLLLSVFFLLLVGSFMKEGEVELKDGWNRVFMVIMFVGILVIFANAIPYKDTNWLSFIMGFIAHNYNSTFAGTIILLIIVIGTIYFIVKEPKSSSDKKDS